MGLSIWQILLVAVLFMLLFGRGRIPALMSDLAEGIKSFKTGIADAGNDATQEREPGEQAQDPQTRDNT